MLNPRPCRRLLFIVNIIEFADHIQLKLIIIVIQWPLYKILMIGVQHIKKIHTDENCTNYVSEGWVNESITKPIRGQGIMIDKLGYRSESRIPHSIVVHLKRPIVFKNMRNVFFSYALCYFCIIICLFYQ